MWLEGLGLRESAGCHLRHLSEAVGGHLSGGEERCWAGKVLGVLGSLETKLLTHRCCCTGDLGRVAGCNQ